MKPAIVCLSLVDTPSSRLVERIRRMVADHSLVVSATWVAESPLVFIECRSCDEAIMRLGEIRARSGNTSTRVVWIGGNDGSGCHMQFDAVLDRGIDDAELERTLREQLTRYVIAHAPDGLEHMVGMLDLPLLSATIASAREHQIQATGRYDAFEDSVLGSSQTPEQELEQAMIDEIDRMFGYPGRIRIPRGQVFAREGDDSTGIWIILEGQVELFRVVQGEDLVFHCESAGRIIGLMSLYRQSPVFFSCRARTDCKMLRMSRDEIRRAIHESPEFAGHLIGVILRSMARRNRRTAELLIKNRTLNQQLSIQKTELEQTLSDLRNAQERLIESEKMCTLGILAAGLAHELNNPVAAILRASDHLRDDLLALFDESAGFAAAARAMRLSMARAPLSTRQEREMRHALIDALGDDSPCAERLFAAGIRTEQEVRELLGECTAAERPSVLERIRCGGELGGSIRNLETCSRRISRLVRSLKVYARDDQDWQTGINLNQTIEDVLNLLANHLRGITLHKEYGVLPEVRCMPSQLEQVWTNLLINAIQAMDGHGEIHIRSRTVDGGCWIQVDIEDNGPGIPADVQPRLFQSRFTTRAGRIEFGLGLGLPISKTLIANHGGRISFESGPGRTCFTILLPITPPDHPP